MKPRMSQFATGADYQRALLEWHQSENAALQGKLEAASAERDLFQIEAARVRLATIEECAKVCEAQWSMRGASDDHKYMADKCAAAIRALQAADDKDNSAEIPVSSNVAVHLAGIAVACQSHGSVPNVITEENAKEHMEKALWEFIDIAAMFPCIHPDERIWPTVLVYRPDPASTIGPMLLAHQEARQDGRPHGSFDCPICGKDEPHSHSDEEVMKYRENDQGFNAERLRMIARKVGLENDIPDSDLDVIGNMGQILGMVARAIERMPALSTTGPMLRDKNG